MIDLLIKVLSGGAGQALGNGIANGVSVAALTATVPWLIHHRDDIAVCATFGDLAVAGVVLFVIVKIVQYTSPHRE